MSDGILDLHTEQLPELRGNSLTESITASGGRTVLASVASDGTLAGKAHHIELARAFGADLVVLGFIERVWGGDSWDLPSLGRYADLHALARDTGRPIAVVLESGDVPEPRRATPWNAQRLADQGAAMICVTAGPTSSATCAELARDITRIRAVVGPDVALWSGRTPRGGLLDPSTSTVRSLLRLVEAGSDGVLVALPGPRAKAAVEQAVAGGLAARRAGAVVAAVVGAGGVEVHVDDMTDQMLAAREMGADAHLLGGLHSDAPASPELLYAYSVALRGQDLTWQRMAKAGPGSTPLTAPSSAGRGSALRLPQTG